MGFTLNIVKITEVDTGVCRDCCLEEGLSVGWRRAVGPLRSSTFPGGEGLVMSLGPLACWGGCQRGCGRCRSARGTQEPVGPILPTPGVLGDRVPASPRLGGINLKQLIASERSHQRLNEHNLTEGMIIDLVKKRKKGKLN